MLSRIIKNSHKNLSLNWTEIVNINDINDEISFLVIPIT